MTDETDQVLTLGEVVGMMRVPRRNIVKRVREGGDLPAHFSVGRTILFRRSAVLAWIEAQEAKSLGTSA
jgi:excisionase family DNA binding protein